LHTAMKETPITFHTVNAFLDAEDQGRLDGGEKPPQYFDEERAADWKMKTYEKIRRDRSTSGKGGGNRKNTDWPEGLERFVLTKSRRKEG